MNKKAAGAATVFAAVIVIAIVVLIVVGLCLPDRAEFIQGQVETTDYRVSSKVPGRVLEIRVGEGDMVRKGDTLVILEAPDVSAKLDQASALYEAAQALDEKARNGAQKEQIAGAYEMWQKAKAALTVMEKSFARTKALYDDHVVTAQRLDEITAQRDAGLLPQHHDEGHRDAYRLRERRAERRARRPHLERAHEQVVQRYVGRARDCDEIHRAL